MDPSWVIEDMGPKWRNVATFDFGKILEIFAPWGETPQSRDHNLVIILLGLELQWSHEKNPPTFHYTE